MAIMMDAMENGIRFQKYLESKGVSMNKSLEFWPHKDLLNVKDKDIFYQIAQATGCKPSYGMGLYFIVEVKDEKHWDHWTVSLNKEEIKSFFEKYGKESIR
ncbi:hypothetical protein HZA33_04195 [Candidatus Pacearchaeota archaeon]|nr:hypothetical protein [Candidatus Pacearchaeota archaeon]